MFRRLTKLLHRRKGTRQASPSEHPCEIDQAVVSPELLAIRRSQAVIEFTIDGTITYANDNFLNLLGYSIDQVVGRHHSMFVGADEAKSTDYQTFWERLGKGEYFAAEFRRFGKNRKEVWIQGSYNPILDESGKPFKVIKFATDITSKKIRSADDNGQLTAIGNSQAVITFSLDGRIESANRIFCAAMGYSESEIVGKHHRMFVPRDIQVSAGYRDFWRALAAGTLQAGEFCRIDRSGRAVWLQASYTPILDPAGRPFKIVKYASDITAAKFRSLQYDAKLTVIGASTAVAEWNLDGRVLEMNPFLAAQLRLDLSSLISQADTERVIRGEQVRREIAWPDSDGDSIWLDATLSQMTDLEGRPEKILMCAVDVTPRRQAVEASSNAMQDMLERMTTIVGNLDRIARTTNMLALNAAVQAAGAGTAGKGFAVVATEVRALAEQSEKAVTEINNLIAGGKARIERLAEAGQASGDKTALKHAA